MREEKVLSTDRQKASSAQRLKFPLALCTILAFTVTWTAVFPVFSQAKSQESVGQRLVADLTWPQRVRDRRFAHMDTVFPVRTVRRGATLLQLPAGAPLLPDVVASYMQSEHLAGVLVLQAGRVRAERYALGLTPADRWTGFSMTKAMTDTLAGAAVRAGSINSLDDDVTRYLPEMRGSAYDGVTVRQLMTMTSGVRWNENYTTADADNVRLYTMPVAAGRNATIEYMRTLHRDAAPGSRWLYNTGETDLLGVLLRRATGRTLAQQLSAAVWRHAGMAHDATWIANDAGPRGEEFGGSGLSATLRDWGRLGLWVMRGGSDTVPAGWFAAATKAQVQAGAAGYGYGWWPQGTDGSYAALGIFGQSIFIDPSRELVIVIVGDWPQASGAAHTAARAEFWQQVKAAVDSARGKFVVTMKPLTITFDPAKARTNLRKHGVSFEEAATVFRDPLAITVPDHEHSDEESREITCGYSVRERLLLVVHTEIVEDCLRIISARKATWQEQDDYANA